MREADHERVARNAPEPAAPAVVALEGMPPARLGALTPATVMALQRRAGNAAVARLRERGTPVPRGPVQRRIRLDEKLQGTPVVQPLWNPVVAFQAAAADAGGEVATMMKELDTSETSNVLLRLEPGEERDYGGATALAFNVADEWKSYPHITQAEWASPHGRASGAGTIDIVSGYIKTYESYLKQFAADPRFKD